MWAGPSTATFPLRQPESLGSFLSGFSPRTHSRCWFAGFPKWVFRDSRGKNNAAATHCLLIPAGIREAWWKFQERATRLSFWTHFPGFLGPLENKAILIAWKWKLVAQSYVNLCDPMDCSPPGSSLHGIFQARILEWVAVSSCRGSSWPRDGTWISCSTGRFFTVSAARKAPHQQFL